MPNDYFQFKQFRIDQGGAAMKVTTEGCILGACIDGELMPVNILDIGAGTGLLSLMLAQKFLHAEIHGVESNESAAFQAKTNFKGSRWSERLHLHFSEIQQLKLDERFDLIIANPPFFNKSMLSGKSGSDDAKHDHRLSQEDLIKAIDQYLSDSGNFYVLYPEREAETFLDRAKGMKNYLKTKLVVLNHTQGQVFRVIQQFSRSEVSRTKEEHLVIYDSSGNYTDKFITLLKPYYLYL